MRTLILALVAALAPDANAGAAPSARLARRIVPPLVGR